MKRATKKSTTRIEREIKDALLAPKVGSKRSTKLHHLTVADEWDVAMDAILENEPRRAARIVNQLRRDRGVNTAAAYETPAFSSAIDEAPDKERKLFYATTKLRPEVHASLVLNLKPGAKVVSSGYRGTVVRVTPYGMIEVRLPGGVVALSASEVSIPRLSVRYEADQLASRFLS